MKININKDEVIFLILLVLVLIPYLNSLNNKFIFDDAHMITQNYYIRSFKYIPNYFKGRVSSQIGIGYMFRPLLMLTYNFNYFLHELKPYGYYIFNILLHFLNALLLFLLLEKLLQNRVISLLIAGLFAVHPINSEAVVYLSSRSDLLVTLFLLLSFYYFLKFEESKKESYFLFTLFLFILALLSKESALILPPLIFAWYYCRAEEIKPKLKRITVIFLLAIFYLAIRIALYGYIDNPRFVRTFWENILIQSKVTFFYLRLFLWPYPLTPDHQTIISSPGGLIAFIMILLLITIIIFKRGKNYLFYFGLSYYLIGLVPKFYGKLNFVASEHHFYLPSIGIYIILAYFLKKLYQISVSKTIILSSGVISILLLITLFRSLEWDNPYHFWRSALLYSPKSHIARNNLAIAYMHKGLYREAKQMLEQILFSQPPLDVVLNVTINLAECNRVLKDYERALELLKVASWIFPHNPLVYNEMGLIFMDQKKEEEALKAWYKAIELSPTVRETFINLGMYYIKKDNYQKAEHYLKKAVELYPDLARAWYGLGLIAENKSEIEQAIKYYQKSISLDPNFAPARLSLGTLYLKRADMRGLHQLELAWKLNPNDPVVNYNLAIFYLGLQPPHLELARYYLERSKFFGYKVSDEVEKFLKEQSSFNN